MLTSRICLNNFYQCTYVHCPDDILKDLRILRNDLDDLVLCRILDIILLEYYYALPKCWKWYTTSGLGTHQNMWCFKIWIREKKSICSPLTKIQTAPLLPFLVCIVRKRFTTILLILIRFSSKYTWGVLYNGIEMRWPIGKQIYNGQTFFSWFSLCNLASTATPTALVSQVDFWIQTEQSYYYFSLKKLKCSEKI